ncbi:MAG TPA: tetratricopeptide repeat protein [Sedimenticola thiotaurini]|uniref:Tetratricopeptide repeat protein n=1 Tax=Sedimenticola thiotaurini TaxID=1543721 RepID=A0A831RLA0_9GAMM|nr:tetratricopeptide repeat protein [Sedimenticola thiotaurini]
MIPRSLVRLLGAVAWLVIAVPAVADLLSEPPPAWRDRLQAVPEADIAGAEPAVQGALREARSEVGRLLGAATAAPAEELAAAYGHLGNLYQLYDVHTLADLCYRNARVLDPGDRRWPYYQGYLALQDGRLQQALDHFDGLARRQPDDPLLALRRGQAWYELNRLERARPLLEQAARVPGLEAAARYYLGQMALQARDYAGAKRQLQRVLALDPAADRVHYPLARAWRGLGETERARQHLARRGQRMPAVDDPLLQRLDALRRGARPLYGRALKAVEQGDYDAAVTLFREGLQRDPDNPDARVSLARALFLSGRPGRARQQLETVLQQHPEHPLARFLRGVLNDLDGAGEAAIDDYRRVIAGDSGHAGALFFLANRLLRAGRFRQAAEAYAGSLDGGMENPFAGLYRLVALHHAGEPDAALLPALRREIERQPGFPVLEYALVRLLALSRDPAVRDPAAALARARSSLAVTPFPPFLQAYALALAAAGEWQQAAELLSPEQGQGGRPGAAAKDGPVAGLVRRRQLPTEFWPLDDPLLSPGPVDAMAVFREYPAAVPF